jgi:membrane protein DedA with SNARE-associated domain
MMEDLIQQLLQTNPLWIYVFAALVACIENIFPPFPSDVALVAVGSLAGAGSVDFLPALICSATGSTLGFITMFKIGHWFGQRILETGKIKFIPLDQVHNVELWFHKYGYWVVVGNRFLSGTRAVVSFFAGMSEMSIAGCCTLSFLSALVWNGILLYAGMTMGHNWRAISIFLEAYGKTATAIIILVLLILAARYIYRRQTKSLDPASSIPKAPIDAPKP